MSNEQRQNNPYERGSDRGASINYRHTRRLKLIKLRLSDYVIPTNCKMDSGFHSLKHRMKELRFCCWVSTILRVLVHESGNTGAVKKRVVEYMSECIIILSEMNNPNSSHALTTEKVKILNLTMHLVDGHLVVEREKGKRKPEASVF